MSRVKFRAWDSHVKAMYDWNTIGAANNHQHLCLWNLLNGFAQHLTPMQYTGLKDKNGVEIYEGDIVDLHQFLFDGSEVECESRGVIGYSGSSFTLSKITSEWIQQYTGYKAGEGEFPLYDFTPIDAHYGLHDESFTVIGNIHENPELLEKAP